jgi:predicted ArsR family transcriptional regulator
MYWFDTSRTTGRPRAAIRRYGRNWLFKTHAELGRETGIKPRQVRDCLKFLTAKGFIERRYQRANGMRTTFISLYPRKVYEAMQEVDQKRRETPGATCSVQ